VSLEAMMWALDAPAENSTERLTLLLAATSTSEEGFMRWSVAMVADVAIASEDVITAALKSMAARDLVSYHTDGPAPFLPTWRLHVPPRRRPAGSDAPPAAPAAVSPVRPTRTALYRQYDAAGVLLYVGVTYSPGGRFDSHSSASAWWPFAHHATWEWYPDRELAETAEIQAITTELPLFNIDHALPGTAERAAEYLLQHAAVTA
jgi:hypothetical protein